MGYHKAKIQVISLHTIHRVKYSTESSFEVVCIYPTIFKIFDKEIEDIMLHALAVCGDWVKTVNICHDLDMTLPDNEFETDQSESSLESLDQ